MRAASLAAVVSLGGCAGGDEDGESTSFTTTTTPMTTTPVGTETGEDMICVPGAQSSCACPNGGDGIQVCNDDGTGLGECDCEGVSDSADSTGDPETTGDPIICGNTICDAGLKETCNSCPEDCGECVPCTLAPSCDNALIPPIIETHAKALDDVQMAYVPPSQALDTIRGAIDDAEPGMRLLIAALTTSRARENEAVEHLRAALAKAPEATAALRRQLRSAGLLDLDAYRDANPEPARGEEPAGRGPLTNDRDPALGGDGDPCADPRLRIRIARIDVPEEYDDATNDEIYCLVGSEGTEASELRLTPVTAPIDEGSGYDFSVAEGVVWGQQDLAAPKGNLSITYNCIESDDLSIYNGLIDAIGSAAEQAGGIAGENGWIFDSIGVLSNLLPSVLALDGDDKLFNASQIVPADQHLTLTAGAYWTVRRYVDDAGTFKSDWDWNLRMEIWGCHTNGQ